LLAHVAQGVLDLNRAVFLDRDGVINHNDVRDGRPYGPQTLEQFVILPGVREAIEAFRTAGYLVIVATNQPDIPRDVIEAMHAILRKSVPLDDIKVCTHVDADNCACRKPKPGLLLEAARWQKAGWSGTDGATSRRDGRPDAGPFSSIMATKRNRARGSPMSSWVH
jgi:histidinol-phosphate phosphatase family protein